MLQRDYLMRLIEQILMFLARALGLARKGQHAEAERELEAAYAALGLGRRLVDRLDASTLRAMAGDKIEALVRVLQADAEIAKLAGDHTLAARREALVAALGRPA
jgi:hypothetical protein